MKFIDLDSQYQRLKSAVDHAIQDVLDNGAYVMGPQVGEFETRLAEFVGVKHAISCANGTDALQLSLMALGIKSGDAVFCPTFTFFASAESIAFVGATPVFVDSEETSFNICVKSLREQIEEVKANGKLQAKAIMAVDLFGQPACYPELEKIAKEYGLFLIEDSAQGLGGEINGKRAGSFGDIATTSFFPAKPLGCYGDGGAIFTNNADYAELLRSYRVHGKGTDKYDNVRIGMNSRLDTLQAAILIEKLNIFPDEIALRNKAAYNYTDRIPSCYRTPKVLDGYLSSWAQYTLRSEKRDEVMKYLKLNGIPSAVYYATCMHQQTAFANLGYQAGDFPVAEKLSQEVFSLPMHPYLSDEKITTIVSVLDNYQISSQKPIR